MNPENFPKRLLLGIPMTGTLRSEWYFHMTMLAIPTNWGSSSMMWPIPNWSPLGFGVADARNLIVNKAVTEDFEWLFFIDHDVLLPHNTLIHWNKRMRASDVPVFGGLYFTKGFPAEPLVYRGRGNSFYDKWKLGDEVWCDGMGLGCHMIHTSILKVMWEDAEEYEVVPGMKARKVFETPTFLNIDKETGKVKGLMRGTEDLPWYERIMENDVFKRAGWPKLQRRKFPFLCDTNVFCRHIAMDGIKYPAHGEEAAYK